MHQRKHNRKFLTAGLATAALVILAGCGSSSSPWSTSTTTSGTRWHQDVHRGAAHGRIRSGGLGVGTAVKGVKAGIGVAASEGYKINYVVADSQTSPTVALAGAQKLVEQDHVFAVLGSPPSPSRRLTTSRRTGSLWSAGLRLVRVAQAIELQHVLGDRERGLHQGLHHDRSLPEEPRGHQPRSDRLLGLAECAAAAKQASVSAEAQGIKTGYLNTASPSEAPMWHRSHWP